MTQEAFVPKNSHDVLEAGTVRWQAPSNIALVKYWGKRPPQLPANPSLSFTLQQCRTETELRYRPAGRQTRIPQFKVFFEGEEKDSFRPKIQAFFERTAAYMPYLGNYELEIHTANTFPHSSGIASSASGMAALSLCLLDLERKAGQLVEQEDFLKKASFLARLGSGSACRSIEGPLMLWGEHEDFPAGSDLFAVNYPFAMHDTFRDYRDTILLVDKGQKQVSSTVGHGLMHGHPYAEARFGQARKHLSDLRSILAEGRLEDFMKIVELEALSLHAMMLSSDPYFVLMRPNTLQILERVWAYRQDTGTPLCFTLDAGANVHLLYPNAVREQVQEFIEKELASFCQDGQYIHDHCGLGASAR